jgi:hypothetical protein
MLEVKLLLVIVNACLWYGIDRAGRCIIVDKGNRLDFVTAIFYCIVPALLMLLLSYQFCVGQQEAWWPSLIHLWLFMVGYYVYSTIEEFKGREQRRWDIIMHHVFFGMAFFLFIADMSYSPVWCWVPTVQISGVFYSIGRTLKVYQPALYKQYKELLITLDFWVFLSIRIVLQTVLMVYAINDLLQQGELAFCDKVIIGGCVLSLLLNFNWFKKIAQRYSKAKAAAYC